MTALRMPRRPRSIPNRLWRTLRRFGRDRRAAMGYVAIFAAIPLVVTLFYVANSAKAINDRTRNQDAADMIALVHAGEAARSLNTMSMNQVTMTQVFATGVTSGSLIPIVNAQLGMIALAGAMSSKHMNSKCKPYKAVPYVGKVLFAGCMVPLGVVLGEYAKILGETEYIRWAYDIHGALDTSSNAVNALNKANAEIYNRFPEAVSVLAEQIAQEYKVTDIFFDDSCANPGEPGPVRATSCDGSDKRQGMNLPVIKGGLDGHTRFCSGLHFGTAGLSLPDLGVGGIDLPSILPDIGDASLINGSYVKRGFPANDGPLGGGGSAETPHLRDFVNNETGIGKRVEDYYQTTSAENLFDGLLNPVATAMRLAEAALEVGELIDEELLESALQEVEDAVSKVPKLRARSPDQVGAVNWPGEQTEDDNVYKDLVNVRVGNMCIGDPISALGGLSGVLESFSFLTGALPDIDVYHYASDDMGGPVPLLSSAQLTLPVVQPGFDDYSDHFKVLAFSYRAPNARWAPGLFKPPAEGFTTYAQAIVYNPDEIGLYSQNWKALLMPAEKMEDTSKLKDVLARMPQKAPANFHSTKSRIEPVYQGSGWSDLVVR